MASSKTVLVTGGSGFIGSALVEQLLELGKTVHTTVRSLASKSKTAPLVVMQEKFPDKLKLFEADLLNAGSFDLAMAGCDVVHHVASPFRTPEKIGDGESEMVKPALEGTRTVLSSVNKTPSVRRVVLTSSVAAMYNNFAEIAKMEGSTLRDTYWNETASLTNSPYSYSKVLAEKEAWKMYEAQDDEKRWDLVVINPSLVLGPSLAAASESGSLFLLGQVMSGQMFFGAPDFMLALVDVRDVAAAHCAAADKPDAQGRYIVSGSEVTPFVDVSKELRKHATGLQKWLMPTWRLPTIFMRLFGAAFGLDANFVNGHVGIRFKVDNQRSIDELAIQYTPLELTLKDHYTTWRKQKSG